MYCPICLNDTLKLRSSGVIKLNFDGLAKNTSHFTYNTKMDSPKRLKIKLQDKIEEYCKWYGEFQNKSPIKNFEIFSGDFECSNNCPITLKNRISVIGQIYFSEEVIGMLKEAAIKYNIIVEAKPKDL